MSVIFYFTYFMSENNYLIIVIIILIIFVGIGAIIIYHNYNQASFNKTNDLNDVNDLNDFNVTGIVLYYSKTCPHCQNVEEFITANNIASQVNFTEKEVSENKNNAEEMLALAKKCNISASSVGVPFLWDGNVCILGDQDIINFFKAQVNIN